MSLVERALRKQKEGGGDSPKAPKRPPEASPTVRRSPFRASESRLFSIDHGRLSASGRFVSDGQFPHIEDELRRIKRTLLNNAFSRNHSDAPAANLVAITSAMPGAGKTFMAINLAFSISQERDRGVLLVDADLRNPAATRSFGVENRPGLLDLLLEESLDLDEVILVTDADGMAILPAGHLTEDAGTSELLSSERMGSLLQAVSRRYPDTLIVFDGPPLLITNEAEILANVADQILFVVQAGASTQASVVRAIEMLDSEKPINLVLNGCSALMREEELGGYYYGYGSASDPQ